MRARAAAAVMRSCAATAPLALPLGLAVPLLALLPIAGGRRGYTYTDPTSFGGLWEEEARLVLERPAGACHCGGPEDGAPWGTFRAELGGNLAADPSFAGPWVHVLCAAVYPLIFQFTVIDPETGSVTLRGTECAAGLASMAAVCAQSAALRGRGPSRWHWHGRVVQDEGPSVGDAFGRVALAQCVQLCEEQAGCASFAHGPNGCHLKGRCSSSDDLLAAPGLHPAGYRTYFLDPCPAPASGPEETERRATAVPGGGDEGDDGHSGNLDELSLLVDMSIQLVEKGVHCLAGSGWPFSTSELIDNRIELAEMTLGAGGAAGAKAELAAFRWSRQASQSQGDGGDGSRGAGGPPQGPAGGRDGAVEHALERSRLRWARRLNSEVGFWHILLGPPGGAGSGNGDVRGGHAGGSGTAAEPLRSEEDAAVARRWLDTGEVRWSWDEDGALCDLIVAARAQGTGRHGPPRVLNTGSGPLAPAPLLCGGGGGAGPAGLGAVPVVAADGLARFYLRVFDELHEVPPRVPVHCPVEELHRCFPRNHFDVVHMRNALDHSVDPLLGLRQMLGVVRPGGWVLLRHAQNEGLPGQFQLGLHQWAFDAVPGPAGPGSPRHFVIWSPMLRADVSEWLLAEGLAVAVHTKLTPHPGAAAAEEAGPGDGDGAEGAGGSYVWVDIQKPLS